MKIIDCREYLKEIKEEMKKEVDIIRKKRFWRPSLIIVQVGDRPDSNKYIRNKMKHVDDIGGFSQLIKFNNNITTEELCENIKLLNSTSCDAIIVQEPLPAHIDSLKVTETIDPKKDLDCLTPTNMGLLLKGRAYVEPCTPKGIIEFLDRNDIDLTGKRVLIIGRSEIVGKPLQVMMSQRNATVTLAHSKSKIFTDTGFIDGSQYDIVVSAIGKGHYVKVNDMTNGVLIDVGINFDENGKMIGDINLDECYNTNGIATPVPFGVGTMTCGMVIKNLVELVKKHIDESCDDDMPILGNELDNIRQSIKKATDLLKEDE